MGIVKPTCDNEPGHGRAVRDRAKGGTTNMKQFIPMEDGAECVEVVDHLVDTGAAGAMKR